MEKKLTLVLAGQEYVIRPLTLGQLEAIHQEANRDPPTKEKEQQIATIWKIFAATIAAALSVDHPEMTEEHVRKLRLGSFEHVEKAVQDIRVFSGLIKETPKESAAEASDSPGEAAGAK